MAFPFAPSEGGSSLIRRLVHSVRHVGRRRQRLGTDSRADSAATRLVFEALEPRFLLNGEILIIDQSAGLAALQSHNQLIQMVNEVSGLTSSQHIQVVDVATHTVVADAPVANVSSINIKEGNGNDVLTIDAASFASASVPSISFIGGGGNNSLIINASGATNWDVSGTNSGKATGAVNVAFQGVQNLQGGTDNNDTFVIESGGKLTGGVDGGAGGFELSCL